MDSVKEDIQKRFGKEEDITYLGIYETGDTIEQHLEKNPDSDLEEEDLSTLLLNGAPMSRCGQNARYVNECLGNEGTIFGFYVEDNPDCQSETINVAGGHDFLVYKDRYIIDTWISVYTGEEKEQCVFDLNDPRDAEKVAYYFGDYNKWTSYNEKMNDFVHKGHPGYAHKTGERIERFMNKHLGFDKNNSVDLSPDF